MTNSLILATIFDVACWLLGLVLFLLIWFWLIRGAVLAALRKHHEETARDRAGLLSEL
jgi:hypothetical protein